MSKTKNKTKVWIFRLLKVVVLLLVSGGLAAYVMRDQITAKILSLAEVRLAEKGFHITHDSHELSWSRGVVIKGLGLYVDEGLETRLAWIENVGIKVPLISLFKDESHVTFSSDQGQLKIETSAGVLEMSDLNFEWVATSESLDLKRFEARMNGLRITVDGGLKWEQTEKKREVEMPDLAPLVEATSWLVFSGGDPTLSLSINPREGGVDVSGELKGNDFQWRALALNRARVRLVMGDGRVEMPEVDLDCYNGNVKAAMVVDYKAGVIEIDEIHSSAEPFELVDAVMGKSTLKSFGAPGGVNVHGKDLAFDLKDFSRSRGVLTVDSPDGILIPLTPIRPRLVGFQGTVSFTNGQLVVDAQRFALHGGTGSGSYRMPLSGGYSYRLNLDLEGISMRELGRSFELRKEMVGTLDMGFDGGGGKGLQSHHGKGAVKVENGKFYAIPLIGAFQLFISGKAPQFRADDAKNMHATFSLANGVVSSSDCQVESATTKVFVEGDVDMVAKSLDVKVRINLKGIAGAATSVVSRVLAVSGKGPFDEVRWRMGIIPDGKGGTLEKVTGAVKGVGDAAKDVGEAAGKIFGNRPELLVPKKEARDKGE